MSTPFWYMQEGGSDNTLLTSLSRNKSVSFISVGQENEEILNLPSTETLPVVGMRHISADVKGSKLCNPYFSL